MNRDLNALRKFYTEQLDILVNQYQFNDFLKSGSWSAYGEWERNHYQEAADDYGFNFCSGETKMVFWLSDNHDYVIKIPFLTKYDGTPTFDYCRAEVRNFKKAIDATLDKHFAWCEKLMTYLGYPIYIMEYCDCDEYGLQDLIYEYGKQQQRIMAEDDGIDEDDYQDDYYEDTSSEEAVWDYLCSVWDDADVVADFCFKNYITDVHSANVGWLNGHLVIIDYSGYGSIARADLPDDWFDCLEE